MAVVALVVDAAGLVGHDAAAVAQTHGKVLIVVVLVANHVLHVRHVALVGHHALLQRAVAGDVAGGEQRGELHDGHFLAVEAVLNENQTLRQHGRVEGAETDDGWRVALR